MCVFFFFFFFFFILPVVPRKNQGCVLYRQIWQCDENIPDCREKGPQGGAFSRDLLDKSQIPRFSTGLVGRGYK